MTSTIYPRMAAVPSNQRAWGDGAKYAEETLRPDKRGGRYLAARRAAQKLCQDLLAEAWLT